MHSFMIILDAVFFTFFVTLCLRSLSLARSSSHVTGKCSLFQKQEVAISFRPNCLTIWAIYSTTCLILMVWANFLQLVHAGCQLVNNLLQSRTGDWGHPWLSARRQTQRLTQLEVDRSGFPIFAPIQGRPDHALSKLICKWKFHVLYHRIGIQFAQHVFGFNRAR